MIIEGAICEHAWKEAEKAAPEFFAEYNSQPYDEVKRQEITRRWLAYRLEHFGRLCVYLPEDEGSSGMPYCIECLNEIAEKIKNANSLG